MRGRGRKERGGGREGGRVGRGEGSPQFRLFTRGCFNGWRAERGKSLLIFHTLESWQ
jgi:hypothetical protein